MRTYEYPLGATFRATTGAHAAARVFGGKPTDYFATNIDNYPREPWGVEIVRIVGFKDGEYILEYVGDIPYAN